MPEQPESVKVSPDAMKQVAKILVRARLRALREAESSKQAQAQ